MTGDRLQLFQLFNSNSVLILSCSQCLGVISDVEKDEFINEGETLEELDLFIPMLKLLERQGNQDEKLLNAERSVI